MFTSTDVALVRHVVQHILVPCIVVIGLLGNSVSIYVLTRKRMRCTTNIYLTALAITDIAYLTMALLLSLKHYEYIKRNSETYHACYGIMMWLIDACAYISIYIAVCFTIERFIAIRYPLKRQTFCTESLAKRVIAGVSLFCLLTTISTAFEHEYRIDTKLIDSHGEPCNPEQPTTNARTSFEALETTQRTPLLQAYALKTWQPSDELKDMHMQALKVERGTSKVEDGAAAGAQAVAAATNPLTVKHNATGTREHQAVVAAANAGATSSNIPGMLSALYPPDFLLNAEFPDSGIIAGSDSGSGRGISSTDNVGIEVSSLPNWAERYHDTVVMHDCVNVTKYTNILSDLGNNNLYKKVYFYFTLLVFVLIPLCVLGTFNCFLIMLVRRSKNVRGDLTNANSIRKSTKRKQHSSSVSQENRVTVTLIAVVLLFIVCQLPWAIYLIVSEHMEIDYNLQAIFGNIFNFLAAINAAANFFLYCVLSDKYRKTVRELITGYKYRKQRYNNNNYNNSSLYASTSNGSRRNRSPKTTSSTGTMRKNASTMSTSSSLVIK